MARLLAAYIISRAPHFLDDIAVADLGPGKGKAKAAEISLQTEIRHNGCDDAISSQPARIPPAGGDHAENLVAVDNAALFIGDHDPVCIPVERDPQICAGLAYFTANR